MKYIRLPAKVVFGDKTAHFPPGFVKFFAEYARFRLQNLPCLAKNGLFFSLKNYFLRKSILALCLLASLPAAARPASRLLSARISGEDGQPLAGVNISFQNQAARTISDQYGRFTLDVPEGALIVLNYAGCPTTVYTREEIEDEFKYRIVFHDHILLPEIVITDLRMEKCGFRSCPFPGSEHLTVSLQSRKWQYYPNPTRDAVSVFTKVAAGFIEVYADNGLRVARIEVVDNQTLVNLARFPAGAYFLFYEYDKRVEPIGQVALIKG